MAVTMSKLFGTKDVFEDCSQLNKLVASNERSRFSAEIVLKSGERRIYRPKSLSQKQAKAEILSFITAIEKATGENVIWRFKGQKTYHFSTNLTPETSIIDKAKKTFFDSKKAVLDYFFPLED